MLYFLIHFNYYIIVVIEQNPEDTDQVPQTERADLELVARPSSTLQHERDRVHLRARRGLGRNLIIYKYLLVI